LRGFDFVASLPGFVEPGVRRAKPIGRRDTFLGPVGDGQGQLALYRGNRTPVLVGPCSVPEGPRRRHLARQRPRGITHGFVLFPRFRSDLTIWLHSGWTRLRSRAMSIAAVTGRVPSFRVDLKVTCFGFRTTARDVPIIARLRREDEWQK
jgi:hypothetical protein